MKLEAARDSLRRVKPALQKKYPLTRLAVFGSTARGEAGATSDVDVLVEVDPAIGLRFVDLADEIEKALGCRADVVSRRAITGSRWGLIERDLVDA